MKNTKLMSCITAASLSIASISSATTIWDGIGGNGASFFQEANWDNGSGDPAPGAIDPGSALAVDDYSITGFSLTNIGALTLGDASTSLTLDNASITAIGSNGVSGLGSLILINGSSFTTPFAIGDLTVTIGSSSFLRLLGGAGGPLESAVNLTAVGAAILFDNESVAEATSDHLALITINGSAVNLGVNATLISANGGLGSTLTAIPEPSTYALLAGLSGLALVMVRRRR